VWAAAALARRRRGGPISAMGPRPRYILAAVIFGFLIWMSVFSVYRYLVTFEVLVPLAVFVLCVDTFKPPIGRKIALSLLGASTAVVLLGGMKTWGHGEWGDEPFSVDMPRISNPKATTVFIAGGDTPWSWLVVGLPLGVAMTQLGGNFPEGPRFKPYLHEMVTHRGGPVYAVVTAHRPASEERGQRWRDLVDAVGLTHSPGGCALLRWVEGKTRSRYTVAASRDGSPGTCMVVPNREVGRDIEAENRAEREKAARTFERYGFSIDDASCELRTAKLAGNVRAFHWCRVSATRIP